MSGLTPRHAECPFCRAPEGEKCVTSSGKVLTHSHRQRWERLDQLWRSREMVFELLDDDERFGLQAGDELLCVNYPHDSKVTVLRRLSDGFDPGCNQYVHSVRFLRFAA